MEGHRPRFEEEASKARTLFLKYLEEGHESPWVDLSSRVKDVRLFARPVEGTSIRCVKSDGPVPCRSAESLFRVAWDQTEADKKKRESTLLSDRILDEWKASDGTMLQLRMQEYALPWPLSNRETLSVRQGCAVGEEKGDWIQVDVSTECEEALPIKSSPVRARIHVAGYHYRGGGEGVVHTTYITHVDAMGSIPKKVLSFGEGRVADRIETFRVQAAELGLHK